MQLHDKSGKRSEHNRAAVVTATRAAMLKAAGRWRCDGSEIAAEGLAVRIKFVSLELYSKQTSTVCIQANPLKRNKVD